LKRLRAAMHAHTFRTPSGPLRLDGVVRTFENRTRGEGFHILKEWDQAAHAFSRDSVPVLMLDYFAHTASPRTSRRWTPTV